MSEQLPEYTLEDIHVGQIETGTRMRKDFGDLPSLAQDIDTFGLHHPILILDRSHQPDYDEKALPYLLLAGERRYQAHLLLHKAVIPCKITRKKLSSWEINVIELHENLQRKSMTPVEESNLKARIHELYQAKYGIKKAGPHQTGHGLAETAAILGESKASVSASLEIAKFSKIIPELKDAKTGSDARKMIKNVKDKLAREELAKREKARLSKLQSSVVETEDKRRKKLISKYVVADFFDGITQFKERTIDLIELDPDWGIMLKAAVEDRGALTADEYNEVAPGAYVEMMEKISAEAWRVLKDNSWCIVWYSIEDWHKETREILEKQGFKVCSMPAVWVHDSNYTATPAYRFGQRCEFFFYARKGNPKLGTMGHPQTFTKRTAKRNERFHIAEKPVELYEEILKVFLGPDRVAATTICGFAGSGNFLLAADNLKHNVVGFDLSQGFKDSFILKVKSEAPGSYKTYKE